MITVSISINGEPLFARSAKRSNVKNAEGENKYITDAGDQVFHKYSMGDGAIGLAKKMLDTIDIQMEGRKRETELLLKIQEMQK